MNGIFELFPVKFYRNHYQQHGLVSALLGPRLDQLFESQKPIRSLGNTITTYGRGQDMLEWEETLLLKDWTDWILQSVRQYWDSMEFDSGVEPFFINMWGNIQKTDIGLQKHRHSYIAKHKVSTITAGSFYLSASPDQGRLIVENPDSVARSFMPLADTDDGFTQELDVYSGDLVLMPAWMLHGVTSNISTTSRVTIAFDIGYRPRQ